MISSENLGGLFKVLTKIMLITFLAEIIGAFIIYFNLGEIGEDKFFFAVFHSVSAFCNAGFSTLSNGLSSGILNNNTAINMAIAVLIILGGIGFPVLLTFYSGIKNTFLKLFYPSRSGKRLGISVRHNISSRIVVITTILLIITGTLFYFLLENGKSLQGLSGWDKWMIAFFGSVMFIGRLGPLTLLTGLFIPHKKQYFKYPKQDLVIN
jgi:Trk-type K+ transport system membrane component